MQRLLYMLCPKHICSSSMSTHQADTLPCHADCVCIVCIINIGKLPTTSICMYVSDFLYSSRPKQHQACWLSLAVC